MSHTPNILGQQWHPGDLVLFYGADRISRWITACTRGPSHVALVFEHRGEPVLVESTTMCPWPCLVQGREVRGVQVQAIEARLRTYPGRVARLPILPMMSLTTAESAMMTQVILRHHVGRRYDTGRAILSATRWLKRLWYPDPESTFCSHLAFDLLKRFGRAQVRSGADFPPGALVRSLRRWGVHDAPIWLLENRK